ncbi:MAG TPA: hypothetical protein VG712_07700 [Gemmatimonadales bacterium]|nr:hypothetical protein [Gemmatimonadales bacterium]
MRSRWLLVPLLLGLGGCADDPEPEPGFALFGTKEFEYGCDRWLTGRPPAAASVFDIPAWGTGKDSVTAAVIALGGWTLPAFNSMRVRAVLAVDSIPRLYALGRVGSHEVTVSVGDPADRRVGVIVMVHDSLTAADLADATATGATIEQTWYGIHGYKVLAHDSLVPVFESFPRAEAVEATIGTLCDPFDAPSHR